MHTVSERLAPNRNKKTVYVLGHKNPDTDSVVSAFAYAAMKQALGDHTCFAVRAGKATPQTEYIFSRFQTPLPDYLPDLIPKVGYFYNPTIRTITKDTSLWAAMSMLEEAHASALPVVDESGRYHSLLHYSFFAQKMVKINNPTQKTAIQTSVGLLASVLHAQTLVVKNENEIRKSQIVVAAAEIDTFKEYLGIHIPENTIVLCGNRADVQEFAIASGVRVLIVTNGYIVNKSLRQKAEEKGVSILVSPYDTSSTTLLMTYSMPVSSMSSEDRKPVNRKDTIRDISPLLATAPGKSLPVVNDSGRVVGVISESDLYREPNIEVILVDHNELSQAIEGIENYRILEIIDHHRIGTLSTRYPITFINKPVGATSTIVASLYQENRVPMTAAIASILLCGILADTLVLQSATTTVKDREMADYLADVTNMDIDALGKDLMLAASNITGRSAAELIGQDMKAYEEGKYTFSVSQIEVGDPREILTRKDEILADLEAERDHHNHLFCALLVTDITELSSLLMVACQRRFESSITLPKSEDSVYVMRDVVSRKKQLMPILSELVGKYSSVGPPSETIIRK